MVCDNFAGGGGASLGIKWAIGRDPDAAVNHDPEALAMYHANQPRTRVYATDVFETDPYVICRDKPVGLGWFSPDCTHHSKARGSKPIRHRGKKSRALAWVVVRWARTVRPRVLMLENVEEFAKWGPLIPKVDKFGSPVLDKHGKQVWVPCPAREGQTFKRWVRALERLGYIVEWKELRACDFGTPTTRKRLFLIARCDGQPIVWPEPTHGKPGSPDVESGRLLPWVSAASIIDWSIPCPSIFLTAKQGKLIGVNRPLAPNTMKRIAAGLKRYVLNSANPFIVSVNHADEDRFRGQSVDDPLSTRTQKNGDAVVMPFVTSPAHSTTTGRGPNVWNLDEPLRTVTSSNDKCVVAPLFTRDFGNSDATDPAMPLPTVMGNGNGKSSLVAPIMQVYHGDKGDDSSRSIEMDEPLRTVDTQNRFGMVQAFLAQHNKGMVGHHPDEPVSTLSTKCSQQQVVTASFATYGRQGGNNGDIDLPLNTVTASKGDQNQVVEVSFIAQHNGGQVGRAADSPLSTIVHRGTQQQVVTASFMSNQYSSNIGTGGANGNPEDPLSTVTSSGQHQACVTGKFIPRNARGGDGCSVAGGRYRFKRTLAFLKKYYGSGGQDSSLRDPVHTLTAKQRMGLVTVDEVDFQLVDIGMRMLTARELFRAQGFPDSYEIDVMAPNKKGKMRPLPKGSQVRMCGNSVCPQMAEALVRANCAWLRETKPPKREWQRELVGV